jgi:ABC-type polysaccharide/polyol phosphate transport system ATPase subunit
MSALIFDHVTKSFPHHTGARLLRDRIADLMHPSRAQRIEILKDISFEVPSGDGLGLIGPNGAGKSTLLNLACGLSAPDSGRIEVHGRVAALLELGSGFHPDLTGAENVRINAAMVGLSRRQTAERFEEIVEFSGVRDFIDEPLRTYSSGMMMRLAFSVAVHVDPEVLIIDEVIGVGDQAFAAKCLERMRRFQREGKTILLATHSAPLMSQLCQHALWLERGRVVTSGPVDAVLEAYRASQSDAAAAVVVRA